MTSYGMRYYALDPRFEVDQLGFVPGFLSLGDPRPAKEQFNENYAHGGGWRPQPGFKLDSKTMVLTYPGDPPMKPFAMTLLRDEAIFFYPHEYVLVLQLDDSFECARMN